MSDYPSEHSEQVALCQWLRHKHQDLPFFAIPNGGHRHAAIGQKMKLEGVQAGVPDLLIARPAHGFAGLFIEMKRQKGGRLSPEQKAWLARLAAEGYAAEVAAGAEAAVSIVERYLAGQWQAPGSAGGE